MRALALLFLFVPISALAGLFGWFVIPKTKIARPGGRFDRTGALLLVPALAALLVAVNQAHAWGLLSPWIAGRLFDATGNFSAAITLAFVASAVSLVLSWRLHGRQAAT